MAVVYCLTNDNPPHGAIVEGEPMERAPEGKEYSDRYKERCWVRRSDNGEPMWMSKWAVLPTREEAEVAIKKYREEHGVPTPEEEQDAIATSWSRVVAETMCRLLWRLLAGDHVLRPKVGRGWRLLLAIHGDSMLALHRLAARLSVRRHHVAMD
jgi:hypothetical protein